MRALFFIAAVVWAVWAGGSSAQARVLVFVPSSLTDVMQALAKAHEAATGEAVVVSIASTAQLARQLEAGAPADVFITADEVWMKWAKDRALVDADSLRIFAGNRLVVAVRREVENWANVPAMLTTERFAMAHEETVPAGRYAQQALTAMGLWEQAKTHAVRADSARATLRMVARGEVDAALVYETDVAVEPETRAIFTFAAADHSPIRYLAGVTATGSASAQDFVAFLTTQPAQAILRQAGFLVPPFNDSP